MTEQERRPSAAAREIEPDGEPTTAVDRDGDRETTVQLLLDHDQNRRLLADRLGAEYTVVESEPDDVASAEFDVCIVGSRSYDRHEEALAAKKEAAQPPFLPYLFLTERQRLDRVPDRVWDAVDEVLVTPLTSAELFHRLDNLLERRRLSAGLERRLNRSEERFETLFETAPDPVIVTSSDGVVSDANEAFARTVDASREELVGQSITEFGFEPTDAVERMLLRVADPDEGADGSGFGRLKYDDGDGQIMELNANVVTALGEVSERIGIFRDVTEREEREAALRRQNERLKQFASTIAHDLRNPLNIAQGHLDVIDRNDDIGTDGSHVDAASQAHDRMAQLIDEILTLARQGQLVMDPEPVDLEAVATRAWRNVETAGATLAVEDELTLLADEGRLCEAFENLFRNAVEYGGDDVSVRVGAVEGEPSGFFVADDGPGVPESDRADVFEAGYTSNADGTGFGLSIVRQIVEGHGWTITVTEGADGGARFEVVGADPDRTDDTGSAETGRVDSGADGDASADSARGAAAGAERDAEPEPPSE